MSSGVAEGDCSCSGGLGAESVVGSSGVGPAGEATSVERVEGVA